MIYCVWYPSGGFGHYINAVLSLYGNNFVRPKNSVEFSSTGDLHHLDLALPKYDHNGTYPAIVTNSDRDYCVLIDNGINDESTIFQKTFPKSKTIKICYSDESWPIVARTLIDKAMRSSLAAELPLDYGWNTSEPWALREKYFLYLRDHALRYCWRPDKTADNLLLESIIDYADLKNFIGAIGITCEDFKKLHDSMLKHNRSYFYGVCRAKEIIHALDTAQHIDINYITDLWDQAVINYYIHLHYDFEVPANNWANWFENTEQIKDLL